MSGNRGGGMAVSVDLRLVAIYRSYAYLPITVFLVAKNMLAVHSVAATASVLYKHSYVLVDTDGT